MRKVVAFILALSFPALAADKAVTLRPPTDGTGVERLTIVYSACLDLDNNPDTDCVPGYEVAIKACAKDATTGVQDCGVVSLTVAASNTAISNLMSTALVKWKAAKGY